eukprot:EG_transcript_27663
MLQMILAFILACSFIHISTAATACLCSCCKGIGCTATAVGVTSSSTCTADACASGFPAFCSAAGSGAITAMSYSLGAITATGYQSTDCSGSFDTQTFNGCSQYDTFNAIAGCDGNTPVMWLCSDSTCNTCTQPGNIAGSGVCGSSLVPKYKSMKATCGSGSSAEKFSLSVGAIVAAVVCLIHFIL